MARLLNHIAKHTKKKDFMDTKLGDNLSSHQEKLNGYYNERALV
jgi:hypothetical protein